MRDLIFAMLFVLVTVITQSHQSPSASGYYDCPQTNNSANINSNPFIQDPLFCTMALSPKLKVVQPKCVKKPI